VEFPQPNQSEIAQLVSALLGDQDSLRLSSTIQFLAKSLTGHSFADVTRCVTTARREALVHEIDLETALLRQAGFALRDADFDSRLRVALRLKKDRMPQRAISEVTGIARDTLRKYAESGGAIQKKG
jgi:hypothetical protein